MPKLLQVNSVANLGSTGKIMEHIGLLAKKSDWEAYTAFGRSNRNSNLDTFQIGSNRSIQMHGLATRFLDNHGLASKKATIEFVNWVNKLQPDVVHLHNIHGYYINYPILFNWLKDWGGPVVWTLHDCWAFTGHCAYFMKSNCKKWITGCNKCPNLFDYPTAYIDQSRRNYELKKNIFTSISNQLTLVPVSNFVDDYLKYSFFKNTNHCVIHNGINVELFKPSKEKKNMIIGVANGWGERKGLNDFFLLRQLLAPTIRIFLVGLTKKQLKDLPIGIEGIGSTNNQEELATLYSSSIALINPTYEDNYPTVNLEAIACGTPVITYKTGGSPESITSQTGLVLPQGDINGIVNGIDSILSGNFSSSKCREYAVANFDQKICFQKYIDLYNDLLN